MPPQVPSYGGPQASSTSTSSNTFAAPTEQNFAPQQMQQAGEAIQKGAQTAGAIAVEMQQQVNQVRFIDAATQAKEGMYDLLYNKDTGALNQKGKAALDPYDGKDIATFTADKYKELTDKISATLSNDAQRRMFAEHVGPQQAQIYGTVESHMAGEYRSYRSSTYDAAVTAAQRQIGMYGITGVIPPSIRPGMTAMDDNADQIMAAVREKARLNGVPQPMADEVAKAEVSKGYMQAIEGAIQSGNTVLANTLMEQKKGSMTPGDILRVQGMVTHQVDGQKSLGAVQIAFTKLSSQIQPTDMDRLTNIVRDMESGGNRDAVGRYIPGQGTAKGSMQVMDATNGNPGYGVTPARDDSQEERARVGRDYLAAMVKQYGNPAQAMAAYNAGPGTLDAAIAKAKGAGAPQNWLAYMPPETQAYVQKGMAKLGAGGGQPAFPTESQFMQTAIDALGPNPRIEQVRLTREQAAAQYAMLDKSRKEQGEQVVQRAQQALIQNGGSFAALDPQMKADVLRFAPDKYDDLQNYAGKIADPVRADNLVAYNQAVSRPEELAAMPDATFESFVKQNFTQRTAREIVKLRDNQINGKIDTSAGAINSKSVTDTLNNRLLSIGINPTPKKDDLAAKERLGTVQKYVRDSIYDIQAQTGKKMAPAEIEAHITGMFAKDVTFQNTLFGFNSGTSTQKLLAMKAADIPDDSAVKLRQLFAQAGNAKPTDDQMLRAYWKWKNAK